MYVGQEYRLLPSVRIMLERTMAYINEQNLHYQAQQAQAQQAQQEILLSPHFIWRMLRNLRYRN